MLKKSVYIYSGGFVFGVVSSAVILAVHPSLYQAFLELLRRKIAVQSSLIKNLTLMIILNNLLAASIASYGGTAVSKVVALIDRGAAKRKSLLYFLPVGVLFVNGEILGLLSVLYAEHLSMYLSGIFPHGFFEIPAIILSGSIGLEISESVKFEGEYQEVLSRAALDRARLFALVVILILIGGILEGGVR